MKRVSRVLQCSAMQCRAEQCSAVQCSAVQCSAVQCSTVQYITVQYSTVQYSTVQYSTVQYSTVQYRTVQQFEDGKMSSNTRGTNSLSCMNECLGTNTMCDYVNEQSQRLYIAASLSGSRRSRDGVQWGMYQTNVRWIIRSLDGPRLIVVSALFIASNKPPGE